MSRTRKLFRRGLLAIAGLLVIIVLLGVLSRLTTPTAAQREALALMEQDGLPDGPDALGLLYTQARDVLLDDIGVVVAADMDQLPAEFSDAEQSIELAPDGRALRVALIWKVRGEWAEVPLPAALIP